MFDNKKLLMNVTKLNECCNICLCPALYMKQYYALSCKDIDLIVGVIHAFLLMPTLASLSQS